MLVPDEDKKTHSGILYRTWEAFIQQASSDVVRTRGRFFFIAVLFLVALPMLLHAEIEHGWTSALYRKVQKETVQAECSPEEKNDRKLVYVSCPIVYMHDFRNQLAGSFVQNVRPGLGLAGLSIELTTEIYQWKEVTNCNDCLGKVTDENGKCDNGLKTAACVNTFEKGWVSQPLPSGEFRCNVDGQEGCAYPPGGVKSVRNIGAIPDSMRSFKKVADAGTISIGENPGRYYLSEELIAQIPARSNPLFFTKDGLPKLPGKITTLSGDKNNNVVSLATYPNNPESDIGDLRARVSMTDFIVSDGNDRLVSAVAAQGPHIQGERHRTLIPWDSNLSSWKNASELKVSWLDEGSTSFDDMVSEFRQDAWEEHRTSIMSFRIWGFAYLVIAVLLMCGPLAQKWSRTRNWYHRCRAARDILVLIAIGFSLSLGLALIVVAMPWFHYCPLWGGILLLAGVLSFCAAPFLLWTVDTFLNLETVLSEHGVTLPAFVTKRLGANLPHKGYGAMSGGAPAARKAGGYKAQRQNRKAAESEETAVTGAVQATHPVEEMEKETPVPPVAAASPLFQRPKEPKKSYKEQRANKKTPSASSAGAPSMPTVASATPAVASATPTAPPAEPEGGLSVFGGKSWKQQGSAP